MPPFRILLAAAALVFAAAPALADDVKESIPAADTGAITCEALSDFSGAALTEAFDAAVDKMTEGAGKKAILELYRRARANYPRFPVGDRFPGFTPRADATNLKSSATIQLLRHLTTIRDAVIAPLESLSAGDTAGTLAAFKDFASSQMTGAAIGAVLSEGPASVATAALSVYQSSVEALERETCLLNIDLEYYDTVMADPALGPTHPDRVDYFMDKYLAGGGLDVKSRTERSVHRERTQCFVDQHLNKDLIGAEVDSGAGAFNPFGQFADAVNSVGRFKNVEGGPEFRAVIASMLVHFDRLKALAEAQKSLAAVMRDPAYKALVAASEAITEGDLDDLSARLCSGVAAGCGPEPGIWSWFVNGDVTFRPDGKLVQGPLTGDWTCKAGDVTIVWSHGFTDKLRLSPDSRSLGGTNQVEASVSGAWKAPP